MRILYITNDFPYPLTSGHLRHYYLLRELSRRHQVTLLSIVRPTFSAEHAAAVAPFVTQLLTFTSSTQGRPRREKVSNQLRALVRREPVERAVLQLTEAVEQLRRTQTFDVAVVSGRRTVAALPALRGLRVVADICDADSIRLRGALRHGRRSRLPLTLLEYARVRQAERLLLRRADHLLFASSRDCDALVGAGTERANVIPNGVDLDYWARSTPTLGRNTLVFTGAMQYAPNADAALWLIHHVLPLVRRACAEAQLFVVGRDPPAQLRQAGQQPGVTVTGAVADVRPYLEQASVFVAPLRFGAGIQNKVLEALAMAVPVIASPLAAAGLRTVDGVEPPLTVATTPADFAAGIVRQLAAAEIDASPDTNGRAFVARHYQWLQSGATLERVLANLVNDASSPSSPYSSPAAPAVAQAR